MTVPLDRVAWGLTRGELHYAAGNEVEDHPLTDWISPLEDQGSRNPLDPDLRGIRRPTPDHGIPRLEETSSDQRADHERHRIGTLDGRVEVSCYCGRVIYSTTWDDVWNGTPVPPCNRKACR